MKTYIQTIAKTTRSISFYLLAALLPSLSLSQTAMADTLELRTGQII